MQIREIGIRCPVTITPFASTDEAIELMWRADTRHLLVTDRTGLVGLVTDGDLLESVGMLRRSERLAIGQSINNEEVLVADVMDTRCPCVAPTQHVSDAAHRMVDERRSALPVVDEGLLLGVLTAEDLMQLFAGSCWLDRNNPHHEPVSNYASHIVKTAGPDDTLATACARISGARIRHLLIVEDRQFTGLISDWDIRFAIGENEGTGWLQRRVRDYMTTGVQTLRPRDTLACASEVMRLDALTAVPITSREGDLLSIITVTDVLRAIAGSAVVTV